MSICSDSNSVLILTRRDTRPLLLTVTNVDGTPFTDLANYKVFFTIKKSILDPDNKAVLQKIITIHSSPAEGVTTINFTTEELNITPGTYIFDVRVRKNDGSYIDTIQQGTCIIKPDISQNAAAEEVEEE